LHEYLNINERQTKEDISAWRYIFLLTIVASCSTTKPPVSVQIREGLGLFESLIPIPPDSVVELYEDFEPSRFHKTYSEYLASARRFMDTLNAPLDPTLRIDTLAIDHAIENFANAARVNKTIFISSSYFFLFNDPAVIRSVISHEFGHIYYQQLSRTERDEVEQIWNSLKERALFYIFRDGEYSGNAKFGGHPEESPAELFASAFNLFLNKFDEMKARLQFVEPQHHALVNRLRQLARRKNL
jgi:hypothetical protein